MIKVKDLCFSYSPDAIALDQVSIDFVPDQIFAVLGESGSGKTTLLRCLSRFLQPQSGELTFNGIDFQDIPEREFRQKLGIVFQQLHLFPHLNIEENMILALCKVQGKQEKTARAEARAMLERLSIPELAEEYPAQISGGQAQRAAIARGLVLKPEYMLLDEPTSALDANTTDDFAKWLLELRNTTNFIIVTHDTLFAERVASHGVYLSQGKILDTGKVETIIKHVRSGCVQKPKQTQQVKQSL